MNDLEQRLLDYLDIQSELQQKRHDEIMAQETDILAKLAAMSASVDTLKAAFDKHLAGASETIPAGHAAVLDKFIPPMDEVINKMTSLGTDISAAIIPVPGAPAK